MASEAEVSRKSLPFTFVILGAGLLAMVTTVYVGHELTRPAEGEARGFLTWFAIGFLCFIELALTLMATNALVRRQTAGRGPSGAAVQITVRIILIYAAVGLVTIALYAVVPGRDGSSDRTFVAIMIGELVIALIVAAVVYGHDLSMRSTMAPVLEQRREHAAKARSLQSVINAVVSAPLTGDALRLRRETLVKKLENLNVALAHSHGGGVGSKEAGLQHADDPAAEQTLDAACTEMIRLSMQLVATDAAGAESTLASLERLAAQMQVAVDTLELR
jgi:hypothetical protein